MTQKDVARMIGISPVRLGQIERAEGPGADPNLAARIREVLRSIGRKPPPEQSRLRIAS
jgi:transcriptional regulator with XRE-family HTH domain